MKRQNSCVLYDLALFQSLAPLREGTTTKKRRSKKQNNCSENILLYVGDILFPTPLFEKLVSHMFKNVKK